MAELATKSLEAGPRAVAASQASPGPEQRPRRLTIDVTGQAVAKIVVGLLVLGFIGDTLGRMRDIFVWVLAATFLAIALNPLVEKLEGRLGRRLAATVVFAGFVVGFIAVFAALVLPFVTQVDQLTTALPKAISDARQDTTVKRLDNRFHIADKAKEHLDSVPTVVFGAAGTVLGGAVAVSTVFFLTLFLLYELPGIGRVILGQIPPERRPRVVAAAHHMNRTIGGYVAGNLLISLICGVVTTGMLYVLGVPYSLALGVFMAIFDLIPLVGATIGSLVVIASAFIFVDVRAGVIMFVHRERLPAGREPRPPAARVRKNRADPVAHRPGRRALRRGGARPDRRTARDPDRRHDPGRGQRVARGARRADQQRLARRPARHLTPA